MKKLISTLIVLASLSGFAQNEEKMMAALETNPNMEINSTSIKVKKEVRPALTTYLNADPGTVEKAWFKALETDCQCDLKKNKGFYEGIGVRMPSFSAETVSIFTRVEEDETGARLDIVVDFGGKFLSDKDTPTEAAKLRTFLRGFMQNFYVGWYREVIDDQRKETEKVAKDHEKLLKEGEKITKNIESAKSSIVKAEEDITDAEKDIADLQVKMEELKTSIQKHKADIQTLQKEAERNAEAEAVKKTELDAKQAQVENLKQNAAKVKQ